MLHVGNALISVGTCRYGNQTWEEVGRFSNLPEKPPRGAAILLIIMHISRKAQTYIMINNDNPEFASSNGRFVRLAHSPRPTSTPYGRIRYSSSRPSPPPGHLCTVVGIPHTYILFLVIIHSRPFHSALKFAPGKYSIL